jgi:basic amino acid/polyamine antiporter, APA family
MNPPGFLRSLSLFDFTMIVMGSIIGTSIFVVPQVVARDVPGQGLMLGAWVLGGVYALSGAFIAAELAWRRPLVGGTYAYLRDAYHPSVAFI